MLAGSPDDCFVLELARRFEDSPEELAELRGVLLREHDWRRAEGLI